MKIKCIELRKYHKWIGIIITSVMLILFFKAFIWDAKDIIVKANGLSKGKDIVQAQTRGFKDELFIGILNKSISALEVNYKKEHKNYKSIKKIIVEKMLNFDYEDPKTLFQAQISMLKEADDDLGEDMHGSYEEENPIKDINQEVITTKSLGMPTQNENTQAKEEVKATNKVVEEPKDNVKIISSPIQKPAKLTLDKNSPSIFIYHTHPTESYMPESVGNFHSLNRKYTVRAVADELTKFLQSKGHNVLHEETLHDYPSYQKSYVRSLDTLTNYLNKYPSLKVIFDVHRDAAPNTETARENSYVVINGQRVAKFSIVVGMQNPNVEKLLVLANYIKAKSDEKYPGLAKKIITKPYKFNQYNSDYYALIEVGNTANTIDEAERTAKYLGEILSQVLEDIKN
ncbi:stage II sporulation protein P [Inediibacterium massiliense]|uniref:stage II sporulation protein P n=1 Tax=Inediibacterium massiliense TaxID=1658111 RepID=UPI0006B5A398|nr:stage II sporulation protein P [Inediibacterium massiliense]